MTIVTIHAAKTHLSRLIERAEAGETIVIARNRQPVAQLVKVKATAPARKFGAMRGKARVTKVFFEPLPESELASWER